MNDPVAIVPARLEDEEIAVELLQAQLSEHDISTPASDLHQVTRAVLSDAARGFMLLARVRNEFVGIAYAAAHLSAEHGGIVGWLEELYVRPDWRGHGIGSALLSDISLCAQGRGWRGLELEVVEGHERAIPLYLRHQFQPLARSRFTRIFSA